MIVITALFLLLAGSSASLAQTSASEPQIIVTGEGMIKAAPDQAWVSIGAEHRSKVSKEAQQRNAEAMTAVMQKLAAFGIPKDAIKTTAIDLQMEFDYSNGKQVPRGYVARNTVEVRVDDLNKLGDVLGAVVNSGASTIHGLRFDVKQRQQIEAEALQSAVREAMAKVEAIAAAAKRTIDRVMRIEELGGDSQPQPMMRRLVETVTVSAEPLGTPVAAGEIEIRAQIRLTVSIK